MWPTSHSHYDKNRATITIAPEGIKAMRNKLYQGVPGLLLLAVLLLSLGLRWWGSDFGLPAYTRYHPDEHALVERAAKILWTGEWDLQRFNYPPFYGYLQAGAYAAYFLWGAAQGTWEQIMPFPIPQYYHVGRLLTGLVGMATVLVVYLLGRQVRGQRAGLLAAALLGSCYLHVVHSHYATFDVMVAFLVALTALFSDLILTRGEAKWYLLAGLCAGLAGATKYNGALVVMLPLLAHVLGAPWGEWGWLSGRLALVVGAFLLGFFGGNPFALGSMPDFLNGLALVLNHYGKEQPGFEGLGNWRWYLKVFLTSPDAPLVVAGTMGLVGLVWRDWRKGLLLIAFPVVYYLMLSRFVVRFERNMVPLLPFLAVGAGWLLDAVAGWLAQRFGRGTGWASALAAAGAVLILALPVTAAVLFDAAISRTDYRELAGQWVEENVAGGSKIAIEHYSIPFDYDAYEVEDVVRISDHGLNWYQQQGYDVLIISDGVWEVLRQQPEAYADKLAVYDELSSSSALLAEFVPQPPSLVVAGYPTIAVYHFAPVRILQVPE
jgi:4-amino-4-deoxy-L-arabinose transferase-like glycosyltransferase